MMIHICSEHVECTSSHVLFVCAQAYAIIAGAYSPKPWFMLVDQQGQVGVSLNVCYLSIYFAIRRLYVPLNDHSSFCKKPSSSFKYDSSCEPPQGFPYGE